MADKKRDSKISGSDISIILSFIALAVQWGIVTNKLDVFEKQLEKQGSAVTKMQQDVSFIKGTLE